MDNNVANYLLAMQGRQPNQPQLTNGMNPLEGLYNFLKSPDGRDGFQQMPQANADQLLMMLNKLIPQDGARTFNPMQGFATQSQPRQVRNNLIY